MSYTRRYVTIDKKGRKHVAFRSMGDAAVDPNIEMDCEQMATWQADPVCQQLHPGLFPMSPTAGATDPAGSDPITALKSGLSSLVSGVTSAVTGAGTAASAAATAGGRAQQAPSTGLSLVAIGALAAGAYFLFGRKRKRRH